MTTLIVPDFVMQLFQKEIVKIIEKTIQTICEMYKLDVENVKKQAGTALNISFELSRNDKLVIVRKQNTANPEERCIARIFNKKDIDVFQCTRRKPKDGCDFCKRHQRMFDEGRLKYGTINDDIPEEISSPVLSKKKKSALY